MEVTNCIGTAFSLAGYTAEERFLNDDEVAEILHDQAETIATPEKGALVVFRDKAGFGVPSHAGKIVDEDGRMVHRKGPGEPLTVTSVDAYRREHGLDEGRVEFYRRAT